MMGVSEGKGTGNDEEFLGVVTFESDNSLDKSNSKGLQTDQNA